MPRTSGAGRKAESMSAPKFPGAVKWSSEAGWHDGPTTDGRIATDPDARWVDTPHGGYALRVLADGWVRVCGPGGSCQMVEPVGSHGARVCFGRLPLSVMAAAHELMGR